MAIRAYVARPGAAVTDSQSVKTTQAGGPRGYDAAKKTNGRKRHALVDTDGRGLLLQVTPADARAQRYLTDVLTRLVNGWPQSRIDELMPWHWATEQVH